MNTRKEKRSKPSAGTLEFCSMRSTTLPGGSMWLECLESYDAREVEVRMHVCGCFSVQQRQPCLIQFIFVARPRPKQLDRANNGDAAGPKLCPFLEHGIITHGILKS